MTSTTRDATSTNIADYNAFVTTTANADAGLASLGTVWSAVAATATVSVAQNTGIAAFTDGFFNTAGAEISASNTLYSSGHFNAITNEFGNVADTANSVWTGTNLAGGTFDPLGSAQVEDGTAGATTILWTSAGSAPSTGQAHIYGVSGILTVANVETAPEPSTLALMSLSAAVLLLVFARRDIGAAV